MLFKGGTKLKVKKKRKKKEEYSYAVAAFTFAIVSFAGRKAWRRTNHGTGRGSLIALHVNSYVRHRTGYRFTAIINRCFTLCFFV